MRDVKRASNTFDSIAEHFDKTRKHPWKDVVNFLDRTSGKTLDLGCGNGRHVKAGLENGHEMVGMDASLELLKIAKENIDESVELVRGNVKELPFAAETFDNILYIATIHHLKEKRVESLEEVKRALKNGGKTIISGWAREQDRWDIPDEQKDLIVPWHREDGEVIDRFYHLYTLEELKRDVEKSGLEVIEAYHSKGNNYVEARK